MKTFKEFANKNINESYTPNHPSEYANVSEYTDNHKIVSHVATTKEKNKHVIIHAIHKKHADYAAETDDAPHPHKLMEHHGYEHISPTDHISHLTEMKKHFSPHIKDEHLNNYHYYKKTL